LFYSLDIVSVPARISLGISFFNLYKGKLIKYLSHFNDILCSMRKNMATTQIKPLFVVLLLLSAVMCLATPVTAATGSITITYRGSGGNYIGDTIIFDGTNTIGNTTMIKITGPGLPLAGVPLSDLGGASGSANTARVDANGKWIFPWDSSRVDASKLQTARYTVIASDLSNPEQTATTSILLKKPEFYIVATPANPGIGDYLEIQGVAEKGVDYVKIDVLDTSGTVLHTFLSPVGNDGSFESSFHVDMSPGQYHVVGSNPSMKNNLALELTVGAPTAPAGTPPASAPATPVPAQTSEAATGTTIQQAPSQTGIASTTIILALGIFGVLLAARSGMKKN
jgi:hypothetical protein